MPIPLGAEVVARGLPAAVRKPARMESCIRQADYAGECHRSSGRDARNDDDRYAPPVTGHEIHRRDNERLYEANALSVRCTVLATPEQRCRVERAAIPRNDTAPTLPLPRSGASHADGAPRPHRNDQRAKRITGEIRPDARVASFAAGSRNARAAAPRPGPRCRAGVRSRARGRR